MFDWSHVSIIAGYLTIGAVALYLQYRSHIAALDKLSAEHERHTEDMRQNIERLQEMVSILHRESKA